ncbi:MAG: hypothetical protein OXG79_13495 [Chloroflexi bacterium]|nr:hypothetical protein [Chloroflexota bacterium]
MNREPQTFTQSVVVAIVGAVTTVFATVGLIAVMDNFGAPAALIPIGLGVATGLVLWVALIWLNRWQAAQALAAREGKELREIQERIYQVMRLVNNQLYKKMTLDPDEQIDLKRVERELRRLNISYPVLEDRAQDLFPFFDSWAAFLIKLHPLAQREDIKAARALWHDGIEPRAGIVGRLRQTVRFGWCKLRTIRGQHFRDG